MLAGHVGESPVALALGFKPVCALERAADETPKRVDGLQADTDSEAAIAARLVVEIMRVTDVHERQ